MENRDIIYLHRRKCFSPGASVFCISKVVFAEISRGTVLFSNKKGEKKNPARFFGMALSLDQQPKYLQAHFKHVILEHSALDTRKATHFMVVRLTYKGCTYLMYKFGNNTRVEPSPLSIPSTYLSPPKIFPCPYDFYHFF